MATLDYNSQLDANITQLEYSAPPPGSITFPVVGDGGTVITTINGAGGPSITLSGGLTGYAFAGSAGTVTLSVSNPATVRSSISAASDGVNTDITQLNGASQVDVSSDYKVSGTQVVTSQQAAIPDATGGITIDTEARAAINTLLAELRTHGLIAT